MQLIIERDWYKQYKYKPFNKYRNFYAREKFFISLFYNYHHNKMLLAIKYFENLFSESMCLKVFLNSLGKWYTNKYRLFHSLF